jgi:hypothetical protein
MAPHIRTVTTSLGARAVQIVYSRRRGARQIEHIRSAHDEVELEQPGPLRLRLTCRRDGYAPWILLREIEDE